MHLFKNNFINTINDPVFVADVQTGVILTTNEAFESAFAKDGLLKVKGLLDVFPHAVLSDMAEEVTAGVEESRALRLKKLDVVLDGSTVQLDAIAGFFDDDKNQLYFVLKGYRSYMELLQFRDTTAKLPDCFLLLGIGDEIILHYGNLAFDKVFSTDEVSFQGWYGGSFSAAIAPTQRRKVISRMKKDIAQGRTCHLDMEMTGVDGVSHYVSIHATQTHQLPYDQIVCATLYVVDERYKKILNLEQENEMFRAINGLSTDVLFRVSLDTLHTEFYGASLSNFDVEGLEHGGIEDFINRGLIYEEDIPTFYQISHAILRGEDENFHLRINSKDGRCDWYAVRYVITRDEKGKLLLVFGSISNIQSNQELQDKASLDLLTGCLNKGTFESYAQNIFNEEINMQTHAFLMIDLDNFKAVNDNMGHFFGDIVLKDIASKLKRIFRDSDLVARIGGDEFAVLMRDIKNEDIILRKAQEIVDSLDVTYKGDSASYRISASVGVALYPRQADDYEEIYQQADLALYHAKSMGKSTYTLYQDNLSQGNMSNPTPFDIANRAFSHYFDQEVALDTFNLLFSAEDNSQSIDLVLQHLGERFGVDRCYIFEALDGDCSAYKNTYEWCSTGVEPQIQHLSRVERTDMAGVLEHANAEGVFYCNDVMGMEPSAAKEILEPQGILSMLHTYVKRDGDYRYMLGFDDCTSKRMWQPTEISTLMYASKIIAQALFYQEVIAYAERSSNDRLTVLDNLNSFAYIVDNESHKIQYFNKMAEKYIPGIRIGDICYETIRKNDCECDDCPMKVLREKAATKTRRLTYNPYLGMHVLAAASSLTNFSGRSCTFLSSTDVSDIVENSNLAEMDKKQFVVYEV